MFLEKPVGESKIGLSADDTQSVFATTVIAGQI